MRAVTLAVIVLIFILLWKSGALHLLSMTELKARQHELEAAVRENPVLSALVFLIGYILVTGLSVPGATVLTLGGGAIFGFFRGVLLVSFASTLGATLAFVLARFLFGDLVRRRFADRLKAVNQGFEREGAYYLFSLRLIPVFPFFIVNILMSLTPIRAGTFYWVSQLGMLPAT
ncbi:MAG: TVP38/TMEM64 family protein, partial [Bdellovibrionota bacterium]